MRVRELSNLECKEIWSERLKKAREKDPEIKKFYDSAWTWDQIRDQIIRTLRDIKNSE